MKQKVTYLCFYVKTVEMPNALFAILHTELLSFTYTCGIYEYSVNTVHHTRVSGRWFYFTSVSKSVIFNKSCTSQWGSDFLLQTRKFLIDDHLL
jgi:hypothetical protein